MVDTTPEVTPPAESKNDEGVHTGKVTYRHGDTEGVVRLEVVLASEKKSPPTSKFVGALEGWLGKLMIAAVIPLTGTILGHCQVRQSQIEAEASERRAEIAAESAQRQAYQEKLMADNVLLLNQLMAHGAKNHPDGERVLNYTARLTYELAAIMRENSSNDDNAKRLEEWAKRQLDYLAARRKQRLELHAQAKTRKQDATAALDATSEAFDKIDDSQGNAEAEAEALEMVTNEADKLLEAEALVLAANEEKEYLAAAGENVDAVVPLSGHIDWSHSVQIASDSSPQAALSAVEAFDERASQKKMEVHAYILRRRSYWVVMAGEYLDARAAQDDLERVKGVLGERGYVRAMEAFCPQVVRLDSFWQCIMPEDIDDAREQVKD